MSRLPFWSSLLLAFLLSTSGLQAQTNSPQDFYQEFEELPSDYLHLYTLGRCSPDFLASTPYPFIGQPLDTSYVPLLEQHLPPHYTYYEEDAFFVLHRYYLSGRYEGLLLRQYKGAGQEHHIHLFVYDNQTNSIAHRQRLAYGFGYEGAIGGRESWLVDINQDGRLDVLTRQWEEYYSPNGENSGMDSMFVSLWGAGAVPQHQAIEDSTLRQKLAKEFPYYQAPRMEQDSRAALLKYLGQAPYQYNSANWHLQLGRYTTLDSANAAKEAYIQLLVRPQEYSLDFTAFAVYQKDSHFDLLLGDFYTEAEAQIMQRRLQLIDSKLPLLLLNTADYCPEARYEPSCFDCKPPRPSYYRCEE